MGLLKCEFSRVPIVYSISKDFEAMLVKLPQLLCIFCAFICMDSTASAQGRGNASRGLGMAAAKATTTPAPGVANASRATSQVGTISSGKGINVGQQSGRQIAGLPRSTSQVLRGAAGVERGAGNMNASNHADLGTAVQNRPVTQEHIANPSENWAKIQQQRSQRADHLRTIAQRNGNSQLVTTADRMDANALRNLERQQVASLPGTGGEATTTDQNEGLAVVATSAATARSTTTPKKGFWFRSR
jgi:hypothetical protein